VIRTTKGQTANESSDAVGLVVALLVRFPQIATIVSHPDEGTLALSFAIALRVDRVAEREIRETVTDHVESLLAVSGEQPDTLSVECERDQKMTFLRITRDVRTFTREELIVLTTLLASRFGAALIESPAAEETLDDDPGAQDEMVDFALEALRDPTQQRSLVGFREEKRVLVYFVKSRKKAKARARS
jgi:hypothetical protein